MLEKLIKQYRIQTESSPYKTMFDGNMNDELVYTDHFVEWLVGRVELLERYKSGKLFTDDEIKQLELIEGGVQ